MRKLDGVVDLVGVSLADVVMDGFDGLLISRRLYLFLPIGWKIYCLIVLWERKGFYLLVDGELEEILSHERCRMNS